MSATAARRGSADQQQWSELSDAQLDIEQDVSDIRVAGDAMTLGGVVRI